MHKFDNNLPHEEIILCDLEKKQKTLEALVVLNCSKAAQALIRTDGIDLSINMVIAYLGMLEPLMKQNLNRVTNISLQLRK